MTLPAEAGGGTEDLGAADDVDDVEVCFGCGAEDRCAEDRWLAAERSCMSSGLRLTLAAVFSLPPNHSSAVSVASHSTLVGGNRSSCGSMLVWVIRIPRFVMLYSWVDIYFSVFSYLKESRLDPGHGEGDGLDGGVGDAVGAGELDVADVADVLVEEGDGLVQPSRLVRAQREQVRRVRRNLERRHLNHIG